MNAAQFAVAAAALGLLSACDGSVVGELTDGDKTEAGATIERDIKIEGAFDRIALGAPADVEVRADGTPGVHFSGGENFLNAIDVVVENGALTIKTKAKNIRWHWSDDKSQPHFIITGAGAIAGADIGGSGNIRIDKTAAKTFRGSIGGSGDMSVGGLAADSVEFAIGGSGNVTAKGTATKSKYSIGGSGDIDAAGLQSTDTDIAIAGSGNISAHATGAANVSVVGAGDVNVTGGAKCTTSKMGVGDVNCS